MKIEEGGISLAPMTAGMYRSYLAEYENDPDLYLPGQAFLRYKFSEETKAALNRPAFTARRTALRGVGCFSIAPVAS